MKTLNELLETSFKCGASDIFIISGIPVSYKHSESIKQIDDEKVTPPLSQKLIEEIYAAGKRELTHLYETGDDDFSFAIAGLSRFRVSTYKQRGSLAAVIRIIPFGIPNYKELNIPEQVMAAAEKIKGLVIVAGPAGSGKSTTLACIIDRINETKSGHIITLEDPIEYLHRNKKSIISQREIYIDSRNYITALRACLRQAPDVILLGEMRDHETIKTAMTAAETGHLVISTLHTVGAANTIDRIIDVFPPEQQRQIRVQLSMILQSVISQQLMPDVNGNSVPCFEVMNVNNAIRTMIRDSKTYQIDSVISSSASEGMMSMDTELLKLFKNGKIDRETAIRYASNIELMIKKTNI